MKFVDSYKKMHDKVILNGNKLPKTYGLNGHNFVVSINHQSISCHITASTGQEKQDLKLEKNALQLIEDAAQYAMGSNDCITLLIYNKIMSSLEGFNGESLKQFHFFPETSIYVTL